MEILSALVGLMTSYFVNLTNDHVLYDFIKQLQRGDEPVNHDLQKAVKRAYLGALQTIARLCHQAVIRKGSRKFPLGPKSYPPACKAELEWLDRKFVQLAWELRQLDRWDFLGTVFESPEEVESLLYPKGEAAQARIRGFEQKFVAHALGGADPSPCYQETVRQELFQRICDYFADEIKHNPKARHIFDSQILAQLNDRVRAQDEKLAAILEGQPNPRAKIELVVEAGKFNIAQIQEIIQTLIDLGDVRLIVKRAEAGSLVLVVEGDQKGLERLAALFQDGKLQEIHGILVKDFQIISAPTPQSQPAKTGDSPAQILINGLRYLVEAITPAWMPEMAGQLPSAADIPRQTHEFTTDYGSVTLTCGWDRAIGSDPAYLWLSWDAEELDTDADLCIRLLNPDTGNTRHDIPLKNLRCGEESFTAGELGFDPSAEPWAIAVILLSDA